jgi:hypothetical protein
MLLRGHFVARDRLPPKSRVIVSSDSNLNRRNGTASAGYPARLNATRRSWTRLPSARNRSRSASVSVPIHTANRRGSIRAAPKVNTRARGHSRRTRARTSRRARRVAHHGFQLIRRLTACTALSRSRRRGVDQMYVMAQRTFALSRIAAPAHGAEDDGSIEHHDAHLDGEVVRGCLHKVAVEP